MSAVGRPRPYRELLTPVLHRRFTRAAGVCLLLCYAEAIIIGDKSSLLWSWFPIGFVGLRTLILAISFLLVFLLRLELLHCGKRATASPFQTLWQYSRSWHVLHTASIYVASAFIFTQVYVWSVPESANLDWVVQGRSWERSRLNERPIYLRSLYLGLALLQTAHHLCFDSDEILGSNGVIGGGPSSGQLPDIETDPWESMKSKILPLLQEIGITSVGLSAFGPLLYTSTVRRLAWNWSLSCVRLLDWDVPHTEKLSIIPPYHYTLIIRSLISSFMLLLLWRVSILTFGAYVVQKPLKREQPLSQDSKDPNGSLINGLKARKAVVRTFAYWELALISQQFSDRRIAIFRDIDRQGGPAWSQISLECLKTISEVTTRIKDFGKPPVQQQASIKPEELQSLPRLGGPLREEAVLMGSPPPKTRREMVETKVGTIAKSYGNNPVSGYGSPISPKTQQYLESARNKIFSPEQQQAMTPANVQSQFNVYLTRFLRSSFGQPFRQTFARRVRSIAFGQPYSELPVIINAVHSLTRLATASLQEDSYGKVSKDVPLLLNTFITTHQVLEQFATTLPPHWTDVEFSEDQRQTEDVRALLGALKYGLQELLKAFGGFAKDVGFDDKD
ncbi:MAG: hypothetical protein Q9183_001403, partial [Haloplaca sp. 2 TL-2023]